MLVVIVGGGPVGLWSALQWYYRCPKAQIIVYEKRGEYTRQTHIRLDAKSIVWYSALPTHMPSLYRPLFGTDHKPFIGSTRIKICDLESLLRGIVQCKVLQAEMTFDDVMRKHPNVNVVIAADGAHSGIRRRVFGPDDEVLVQQDMQKITQVTFDDKHIVPIDNTPKNIQITENRTVIRYFNLIDDDDKKFDGAIDVRRFKLSVYFAKAFHTDHNGVDVYLVGDAALGLPYYRSLNAGLLLASQLAKYPNMYNNVVRVSNVGYEWMKAIVKNVFVNTALKTGTFDKLDKLS